MMHPKTLAALLTLAAAAIQLAAAQVRCKTPAPKVALAPTKRADTGDSQMLTGFFPYGQQKGCLALTGLKGAPSWSYCRPGYMFLTRPVAGGDIYFISNTTSTYYTAQEMNLAGDILNSITEASANSQLATLGQQSIIDFNHEALPLPNGYTALIAHNERLYTNVQGPGTVDILGDEVLVLDANWNIVWTWNAFDFLPVSRPAVLGETCKPCPQIDLIGCCPITLAAQANDWLHSNALSYDSTDGNLVISIRNQDWIVKIAYENGTGDGHLVWTLGYQGGFTMLNTPNIPSPWFSHQHDAGILVNESPKEIILFDNGNTRHATDPTAVSRGQVLTIDETTLTADIHTNVNLPVYSRAYGTAQVLDNGNYWWQAGIVDGPGSPDPTRSYEYVPSGVGGFPAYEIHFADIAYRSFRLVGQASTPAEGLQTRPN
jgi:arylsulfate sulfotransferase